MVSLYFIFLFFLCDLKLAQSDAVCPELAWSSSTEAREVQGQLRSPPRSVSPPQRLSPTRTGSPTNLDPTLQAVQATIKRWRQREQV